MSKYIPPVFTGNPLGDIDRKFTTEEAVNEICYEFSTQLDYLKYLAKFYSINLELNTASRILAILDKVHNIMTGDTLTYVNWLNSNNFGDYIDYLQKYKDLYVLCGLSQIYELKAIYGSSLIGIILLTYGSKEKTLNGNSKYLFLGLEEGIRKQGSLPTNFLDTVVSNYNKKDIEKAKLELNTVFKPYEDALYTGKGRFEITADVFKELLSNYIQREIHTEEQRRKQRGKEGYEKVLNSFNTLVNLFNNIVRYTDKSGIFLVSSMLTNRDKSMIDSLDSFMSAMWGIPRHTMTKLSSVTKDSQSYEVEQLYSLRIDLKKYNFNGKKFLEEKQRNYKALNDFIIELKRLEEDLKDIITTINNY